MLTADKKIIEIIDELKALGRIKTKNEAYEVMGLDRQRVNNIRNQANYNRGYHFSTEHLRLLCKAYQLDANKLLGL